MTTVNDTLRECGYVIHHNREGVKYLKDLETIDYHGYNTQFVMAHIENGGLVNMTMTVLNEDSYVSVEMPVRDVTPKNIRQAEKMLLLLRNVIINPNPTVEIEVFGGVVHIEKCPAWIDVEKRDADVDGAWE